MNSPYNIKDEVLAIYRAKRLADDAPAMSDEERTVVAEERGTQFGLLLGRNLRQAGIAPHDVGKIIKIVSGDIPDDGTVLNAEAPVVDAVNQALVEFREFLGLDQSSETRT